jgi:hypothetical protein
MDSVLKGDEPGPPAEESSNLAIVDTVLKGDEPDPQADEPPTPEEGAGEETPAEEGSPAEDREVAALGDSPENPEETPDGEGEAPPGEEDGDPTVLPDILNEITQEDGDGTPQPIVEDSQSTIENILVFQTAEIPSAMVDPEQSPEPTDEATQEPEPEPQPEQVEDYEERPRPRRQCGQSISSPQSSPNIRSPRSPRAKHRSPPPPLDSPEVGTTASKFIAGQPVQSDDPEFLAVVVLELEDRRDVQMLDGNFMEAMRAQKAVDMARYQHMDATKRKNMLAVQKDVENKKQYYNDEHQQFLATMKQREDDLEQKIKEQEEEMRSRHMHECDEHDQQWSTEPKQRQFNRSSQKLRILRVQQQLLMNARRYEEAAQVCKIADSLSSAEVRDMHRACLVEFLCSRALLEKKHADEVDTLAKASDVRRGEHKFTVERGTKRFTSRSQALKYEEDLAKDPEKLWILKHRHDGDEMVNVLGSTRTPKFLKRCANVAEFNTLPLPALPVAVARRRSMTMRQFGRTL